MYYCRAVRIHIVCQVHLTDVIGMGMAATGKFIATCNDKTELLIWSLKGEVWSIKSLFSSLKLNFKFGRFLPSWTPATTWPIAQKSHRVEGFLYLFNEWSSYECALELLNPASYLDALPLIFILQVCCYIWIHPWCESLGSEVFT